MELRLYEITYRRYSDTCWYEENMLSVGTDEHNAIEKAKSEIATQRGKQFVETTLGKFEAKLRESVMGHKITVS